MANLSEDMVWKDGIYQLETTDPVVGGPEGIDNRQAKELASRTQYLKAQVELRASIILVNTLIDAAVQSILNSSPATLDTLNELAAALGDDPNFAASMTALIGTKLDATSYTAEDILTKLRGVDGSGSGLDADLVQGQAANEFAKKVLVTSPAGENSENKWYKLATISLNNDYKDFNAILSITTHYHGKPSTVMFNLFVRRHSFDSYDGEINIISGSGGIFVDTCCKLTQNGSDSVFDLWMQKAGARGSFSLHELARSFGLHASVVYHSLGAWQTDTPEGNALDITSNGLRYFGKKIWHEGNDGPGSTLDADTVDGKHASEFVASISPVFTGVPQAPTPALGDNSTQLATTQFIAREISALIGSSPATLDTLNELAAALGEDPNFAASMSTLIGTKMNSSAFTAAAVLALLLTVDGAGSGIDADKLDGQQGNYYAPADAPGIAVASCSLVGTGIPNFRYVHGFSSVADLGTGLFRVTFAQAQPTANYVVVATARRADGLRDILVSLGGDTDTYSENSFDISCHNGSTGASIDPSIINIVVFGA